MKIYIRNVHTGERLLKLPSYDIQLTAPQIILKYRERYLSLLYILYNHSMSWSDFSEEVKELIVEENFEETSFKEYCSDNIFTAVADNSIITIDIVPLNSEFTKLMATANRNYSNFQQQVPNSPSKSEISLEIDDIII